MRDLLDASQVDSHGIQLDLVPVRLPELASSIVSQLAGTLEAHGAAVVVVGEPPAVLADPLRLEQVVANLLENAAKYSGKPCGARRDSPGRGLPFPPRRVKRSAPWTRPPRSGRLRSRSARA